MANYFFWVKQLTGGGANALDGINANDCLGNSSMQRLTADMGAAVVEASAISFYRCKSAPTAPPESLPTIVVPDVNTSSGDEVYWELVTYTMADTLAGNIKTSLTIADTVGTWSGGVSVPGSNAFNLCQISDIEAGTGSFNMGFNTADEANFFQEDNTKTDFVSDLVRLHQSSVSTGFKPVGATPAGPLSGTSSYFACSDQYIWTANGYNLSCYAMGGDTLTPAGSIVALAVMGSYNTCAYGPYLYIGEPLYDGAKTDQGRICVYQTDGTTVTYLGAITQVTATRIAQFGYSMAVCGTALAVGVYGLDQIHFYTGTPPLTWTHELTYTGAAGCGRCCAVNSDASWYAAGSDSNTVIIDRVGSVYTVQGTFSYIVNQLRFYKDMFLCGHQGVYYYIFRRATATTWQFHKGRTHGANFNGFFFCNDAYCVVADSGLDTYGTNAGAFYYYTVDPVGRALTDVGYAPPPDYNASRYWGIKILAPYNVDNPQYAYAFSSDGSTPYYSKVTLQETFAMSYLTGAWFFTTLDASRFDVSDWTLITACTVSYSLPGNCFLKSLVSFDGRVTWKKWNGSSWVTHSGGLGDLTNGNTMTDLDNGLTNLDVSSINTIDIAILLERLSGALTTSTPSIDNIYIAGNTVGFRQVYLDYDTYYIDGYRHLDFQVRRAQLTGRTGVVHTMANYSYLPFSQPR